MLNILWILYFGGHPESPTNQFIDSFSMKHNNFSQGQLLESKHADNEYALPRSASHGIQVSDSRHSQLTNNPLAYMSLSQLNGMENFSNANSNVREMNNSARNTVYQNAPEQNFTVPTATFRYKARALYSYDASPDDINEVSFAKDEILEVDDIDGKWWQARRANGQVGICPSNYVKLLD